MAAAEVSPFETSEMLATFLASTPLLPESWRLCSLANATAPRSFLTERVGGVVYVAFSGNQMAGGGKWDPSWGNMVPLECIGDVVLFPSQRNKEGEEPPVMVHAGMLNLFWLVFKQFQNQMLATVRDRDTKSIVITGHSIEGATASLCTLWLLSYLQSISSSISVLCITFGSPMLGNKSFSQAILKERWGGNFCHVVSKHDIMPRLLFAPVLTSQLSFLFQFWHLSIISPDCGKLAIQISDEEREQLFGVVMDYLNAAATDNGGEISMLISFHPFGSFFFVSEEGAVCVDSPSTIIKMMHLMFATSSPTCSIEDHLNYGDYVNRLSLQLLNKRDSLHNNIPDSSYEAGLQLAIQSSGIANQESAIIPAKECLKTARRTGPPPTLNAASLAVALSKVAPYRAEIEWYQAWCDKQDDQMGYHDSFKRRGSSKRDMKVNLNRHKLARFWNNVVDMLERNELPHDFYHRAKWINASQSYKLLVEPLDIAEYYRNGIHRIKGHYLHNNRERRYEVFDKWWKNRGIVSGEENNNERTTFASLTQDSCFWARVEEAKEWLDSVRGESDSHKVVVLWEKIEKFEKYAQKLIENKEVSKDVLAKNSSYSVWVEDLKGLKELKGKVQGFSNQFTRFLDGEVVP